MGLKSVVRNSIVLSGRWDRPSAHPQCRGVSGHTFGKGVIIPPARFSKARSIPQSRGAMTVLIRCRSWRFTQPIGDLGSQLIAPAFVSPLKRSFTFIQSDRHSWRLLPSRLPVLPGDSGKTARILDINGRKVPLFVKVGKGYLHILSITSPGRGGLSG